MRLLLNLVVISLLGLLSSLVGANKEMASFHGNLDPVTKKDRQYVVVITGCSTGIGEQAALALSTNPRYKVWATMRNPAKSRLPVSERSNLKVAELDVTSEASVLQAIQQIVAEDGTIDILVNNAGFGMVGTVESVTVAEAQELFDVNVWGVVRVLQAVLPHMRRRKWGHVINISSTSGLRGIPCMEFYTASKFALEGLTDSMRYSLAAYNISVTNLNAGPVRTAFTDRFGVSTVGGRGTREVEDGEYLQVFADRMVAGLNHRMQSKEGQAVEEVGQLLLNLVSLRINARRLTDVPFNIGSSPDSQKLLEEVRRQPTGWGGVYSEIFKGLPSLEQHEEMMVQRRAAAQQKHANAEEL